MYEIAVDDGVGIALDALIADRLALICGAGLSMSPPSNLPSAADLAAAAKARYDSIYGQTRVPLPSDIGEQAEYFFQRQELATVYLRKLIDHHAFAGQPNLGHSAVADLLLTGAAKVVVSTNVDTMIETAGQALFGQVGAGIDRDDVATLPADISPLLKIHGCWSKDRWNTVWALGQLSTEPIASRIARSAEWLRVKLLDRDLIVVGYFTDWDYLNALLETTLGAVTPARILVVNPDSTEQLRDKAPNFLGLGAREGIKFLHVKSTGDHFLNLLRQRFSLAFIRQVIAAGAHAFNDLTGAPPAQELFEVSTTDTETLWRIRRDLEGCAPNSPGTLRTPPAEPTLGLTILQLRAKGAVEDGLYWLLNGRKIRVLRTANQLLHVVESAHSRETPPIVSADLNIAVGAEAVSLPPHLVRGAQPGSITRGSVGVWRTRPEAIQELEL